MDEHRISEDVVVELLNNNEMFNRSPEHPVIAGPNLELELYYN